MNNEGEVRWPGSKPTNEDYASAEHVDSIIPQAKWFWEPLERFCVAGCCGLEAYDFSPEFVRWVTHQSTEKPKRDNWRHDEVGDLVELASQLRNSADEVAVLPARLVLSSRMNHYFERMEFVQLLHDLADILEEPAADS